MVIDRQRMRLGLLSDPDNFHTDKWGSALARAGLDVRVYSFNPPKTSTLPATQIPLPAICGGKLNYLAYLMGGTALRKALLQDKVDVVNALNVTPFGVWAQRSGFHPWVASAMGADILEFMPKPILPQALKRRSWDNVEGKAIGWAAAKAAMGRPMYRHWVGQALQAADWITADNQTLLQAIHSGFGVDPGKTELLRWGLEPAYFKADPGLQAAWKARLGLAEGDKLLFSPRGLKAIYQSDIILEAFLRLVQGGRKDCVLVMLGAGYSVAQKSRDLAQAVRAAGGRVVIIDEVLDRRSMGQLWGLVDVFVSAPVYDGYSAALAEGRFAGAVPVVNAIPGNLELIQHMQNGWICDPFNATQLASDLHKMLDQLSDLKDRFRELNKKWILENSLVDVQAAKFVERLEWVRMQGKKSPPA